MKHSQINWAHFVSQGLRLVGKPYRLGSEVDLSNPDPNSIRSIDCSELVEWLFSNLSLISGEPAGIVFPDGSYNQAKMARHVPVDHLLIGDLAFKWNPDNKVIHHVGVNVGEGRILEAKGSIDGTIITPLEKFMSSSHFAFFGRHPKIVDA